MTVTSTVIRAAANKLPINFGKYTAFSPDSYFYPGVTSFVHNLPTSYTPEAIKSWYLSPNTDPLHPIILSGFVFSVLTFIAGELTGNVSQVDRLWNILPLIHGAHLTFYPKSVLGKDLDPRMLLVFALQIVWSLRIATNSFRRGFYSFDFKRGFHGEDYRWLVVKEKIPKWAFSLLNLTFIAFVQNILLAFMELPVYVLLCVYLSKTNASPPLGAVDYALAAFTVFCLAVELEADNQQQRFQHKKQVALKKNDKSDPVVSRGFVTGGLWGWSRHPNFAFEQFHWYLIYAFTVLPFLERSRLPSLATLKSIYASRSHLDTMDLIHAVEGQGGLWNYSLWAPVAMTVLFYSSTDLTERISSGKYPLYKEYQKRVGMFNPAMTLLKGAWLFVTGRKRRIDQQVFGKIKPKTE